MIENYNDIEKEYEVIYSDNSSRKYTTQELHDFFIFTDTDFDGDFSDFKWKLDAGMTISVDYYDWDWSWGTASPKGKLKIKKLTTAETSESNPKSSECKHEEKYINQAGGILFWVCPFCKKDLGNA